MLGLPLHILIMLSHQLSQLSETTMTTTIFHSQSCSETACFRSKGHYVSWGKKRFTQVLSNQKTGRRKMVPSLQISKTESSAPQMNPCLLEKVPMWCSWRKKGIQKVPTTSGGYKSQNGKSVSIFCWKEESWGQQSSSGISSRIRFF